MEKTTKDLILSIFLLPIVVGILVAIVALPTGVYVLPLSEDAVIVRYGKVVKIVREPISMSKEDRGGSRGVFQDNNGVKIEIRQLRK